MSDITPERTPIEAIKERIEDRKSQAALYAALAKAQGEFLPIAKNRNVKIAMKSGGSYQFRYADLEAILAATRPALSKNGLAVVQMLESTGAGTLLVTKLVHAEGGVVYSDVKLPSPSDADPKAFGAVVTYFRRYTYSAAIGVAADDDLDENEQPAQDADAQRAAELTGLISKARAAAAGGTEAYKTFWAELSAEDRKSISALHTGLKKQAEEVDAAKNASGAADSAA
jgi:hypothetical protein